MAQLDRPDAAPAALIRPLAASDLDALSAVHCRACRIAYRFMGWAYGEDEVRDWYAGKLREWDWGRVACAEGRVVGYLAAIGGHIDQLFVDPDHQRRGLGRTLLGAALARGPRPATLHVHAGNRPARRLHEAYGFREAGSWWDAAALAKLSARLTSACCAALRGRQAQPSTQCSS